MVLGVFLRWEEREVRHGRTPLLAPDLLHIPQMRAGLSTVVSQYLILAGTFFVLPLYLQLVLGKNALETGLKILPISVTMMVAAGLGPRLADRMSPRRVVQIGLGFLLVSIPALMLSISPTLASVAFALSLAGFGAGIGLVISQLGNIVMSSVAEDRSSEAGGVQGAAQNLGQSLGTALIGAVLLTGLTTGFVARVEANPAVPPALAQQIKQGSEEGRADGLAVDLPRHRPGGRAAAGAGRRTRRGLQRRADPGAQAGAAVGLGVRARRAVVRPRTTWRGARPGRRRRGIGAAAAARAAGRGRNRIRCLSRIRTTEGAAPANAAPELGAIRRGIRHYVLDGWRLGGIALTFVRRSRPLQRFVLAAATGILLSYGVAAYFGVILRRRGTVLADVIAAVGATYILAVATTAAAVGLAGIVANALDGRPVVPSDGWRLIVRRRRAIAGWAAIDLVFGVPARVLGKTALEQLTVIVFGFGWGLLSFFVMPAIALTQVPAHTAARSALLVVRRRWGAAVSGMVYLWLRAALTFGLPGAICVGVGVLLVRGRHEILGALLVAIGRRSDRRRLPARERRAGGARRRAVPIRGVGHRHRAVLGRPARARAASALGDRGPRRPPDRG